MTPACRAGSPTHILLYLGHGGSLWFSWLSALILPLNSGRGKSLAGSCHAPGPCSALVACHGSESGAGMSPGLGCHRAPAGLARGYPGQPPHKGQVSNERKVTKSYKAWKKAACLIFPKRQVILWMVRKKRRFPWLCNNSLNQSRALQWWHLTDFLGFFQDKVLLFRTGSRKLERIPGISLMPRKVGTSNLLTYFSWRLNSISLGVGLQVTWERLSSPGLTLPLSYFSLFLPQGPSLSILSVLKSLIKK